MSFKNDRSDPVTECRSCRASIVFLRTSKGKSMPVDASKEAIQWAEDGLLYESGVDGIVSHFQTCPQAKSWSKKK